MNYADFLIY